MRVSAEEMLGRRSGSLVIVEEAERLPPRNTDRWLARCDCGGSKVVNGVKFRAGEVASCGCRWRAPRHGHNRRVPGSDRHAPSPEYRAWHAAIMRCENPRNPRYPHYGGRGIGFSPKWRHDFAAFLADMGPKPSSAHTLERIDNDRGYEPGNCRWATRSEQNRNRRYLGRSCGHCGVHGHTRRACPALRSDALDPDRIACSEYPWTVP